jgi:hypothetical protein
MVASFFGILIASVGFGAGAEGMRQYQMFKARRRLRDYAERNAGFWTDLRLYLAEIMGAAIALAPPWGAIIMLTSSDRPVWVTPLLLPPYVIAILIIVRGLNRPVNTPASQPTARRRERRAG